MDNIIKIDFNPTIEISEVEDKNQRQLDSDIQLTTEEPIKLRAVNEHTCEPIKDVNTLRRISEYLIDENRYRDNMIFILGINFGLRVSDLRTLRFSHLLTPELVFKDSFPILEKKTEGTRKRKKNRLITINSAVIEAVKLYLRHNPNCSLNDFLFRSEGNRANPETPLSARQFENIIKNIKAELNLSEKLCTHSLRKTFGYHQMAMSNFSNEKLFLLQDMFNHSSPLMTLKYIGLTQEDVLRECNKLNLGTNYDYSTIIDSKVVEASTNVRTAM